MELLSQPKELGGSKFIRNAETQAEGGVVQFSSSAAVIPPGVPSIRAKALSNDSFPERCAHRFLVVSRVGGRGPESA